LQFAFALEMILAGKDASRFAAATSLRFLPGCLAFKSQVNILFFGEFEAAFVTNQFFHMDPNNLSSLGERVRARVKRPLSIEEFSL
jgi:hypothetical protein